MPYATINGFLMFYDVRGEGDVVVFIHGGFPSIDMHLRADPTGVWGWEMDFTSEFRYVMYDRRGCWLSSRPECGYDLENQARDLAELLDHLDIERAHVIGSLSRGSDCDPVCNALPGASQIAGIGRYRSASLAGTTIRLPALSKISWKYLINRVIYRHGRTGRMASNFLSTFSGNVTRWRSGERWRNTRSESKSSRRNPASWNARRGTDPVEID